MWCYTNTKPLVSNDYFETPQLKRFYIDVVTLSTKDKSIILAFEDGEKHSILLTAFEDSHAKELSARLYEMVNKQSEGSVQ